MAHVVESPSDRARARHPGGSTLPATERRALPTRGGSLSVRRQGQLLILLAAVLWSTAGIGQRTLDATAATQVAGRALFAALTLFLAVVLLERARTVDAFRTMGRWGLAFAVLMAISSGTFMLSLNHTSVANVLFMQAAAPMLAAALGWILLGDPIGARTAIAIAIAILGVGVMVIGSLDSGAFGTVLPFVMSASFAGVVVIARHRSEVSMLPGTCLSQVLVFAAAAPFAAFASVDARDWAVLAALGAFQMGTALLLLTVGARLDPSRRGGAHLARRGRARAAARLAPLRRGARAGDARRRDGGARRGGDPGDGPPDRTRPASRSTSSPEAPPAAVRCRPPQLARTRAASTSGSNVASGQSAGIVSRVSARSCESSQSRCHLRSAGTTNHGATSVEQRRSMSSYAA